MSITLSTCFYVIKSKFDPQVYVEWMNNFLSIVNEFNLVIYTDENSKIYIDTKNNPRIKIIVKPFEQFYNYRYKDVWIKNHERNLSLKYKIDWKVNMLWSEKIWFVKETIENAYFDTDLYGWCDIGYFRNRYNDLHTDGLSKWANQEALNRLDLTKIFYACINNNTDYINRLRQLINTKNEYGLPIYPIPESQVSIAGGFFILHKDKIDWWSKKYDNKLKTYFEHDYLVKDDQIILADCIFSEALLLFEL